MVRKTLIFDLDDTLIPNHKNYSYQQLEFIRWMLDNTPYNGPDAHYILNKQVAIDDESAKLNGFGRERFPTSLQLTMQEIFKDLEMGPSPEQLREVYGIGEAVFDKEKYKEQGLLSEVEKTLDALALKGDELILLTKGDPKDQQNKVDANHLGRWFPEIKIVLYKDIEVVNGVIGERDKRYVCLVGNSIPSDIEPALRCGVKAAYIPCETWQHERNHNGLADLPNRHNLHVLGGIGEILDKYHIIFGEK